MLNLTSAALKVFLAFDPCNMRKSFIETQTRQSAAPPACRELIRRTRSLLIAHLLHEFILGHYKTQRPASNVGLALMYSLNQWPKILHGLSQGVI